MGYQRYNPHQIRFIKEHAGILTAQVIANHLGVTKNGVHAAIKRLGLDGRIRGENHHNSKLSKLQVAMITTLHDAGFTVNEIYNALFLEHSITLQTLCDVVSARTWK